MNNSQEQLCLFQLFIHVASTICCHEKEQGTQVHKQDQMPQIISRILRV